jgi:hypothetical protein
MSTTPYTTDYKAEDHHLIMHRTWCVVKVTAPFTALPPLIRGSSRESVFSPPSSRCTQVLAWETAVVYQILFSQAKKKVRSFYLRPFSTGTDFRKNSIAFPTSSSRPCMRNETLVVREAPRFWRRRWSDGPEAEWAGRRHVGSSSMRFNKNLVRPAWAQGVGEGEQE